MAANIKLDAGPGFKLFTSLYKRKREKQGRRQLTNKEFEEKVAGHWKALNDTERNRYKDAAEKKGRGNKAAGGRKHSAACQAAVHRSSRSSGGSSRRMARERSRSPIRVRDRGDRHRHRRDRSSSVTSSSDDSSARTEYLGDVDSYYTCTDSETDTASRYYDDEDADSSDATSCTSLASYTDCTEPTTMIEADIKSKPSTSRKRTVTKTMPAQGKQQRKAPVKREAARKAALTKIKGTTAKTATKSRKQPPKTPAATTSAKRKRTAKQQPKKTVPPRVRLTRRTVALKKTPASLTVNLTTAEVKGVTATEALKPVLPRRSSSDGKLKTTPAIEAEDKVVETNA